jgi:uncharacterized protein YggE
MRRYVIALMLVCCLTPVSAMASSWSWSTAFGSGSLSTNASSTVSGSGTSLVGTTAIGWTFAVDTSANTFSGTAAVNGSSLGWSELLQLLF